MDGAASATATASKTGPASLIANVDDEQDWHKHGARMLGSLQVQERGGLWAIRQQAYQTDKAGTKAQSGKPAIRGSTRTRSSNGVGTTARCHEGATA